MNGQRICDSALLIFLGTLLLAACGGGGSSGGGGGRGGGTTVSGGGFASNTGPGDTLNYFPTAVGNAWDMTYVAIDTNNAASAGLLRVTIPGTKMVLGASAAIFDQQDSAGGIGSSQNYYVTGNGGVTYVGTSDPTDVLTPQLVPFVQLLFPVATGQQSKMTATNLAIGNDAQGKPVTFNMIQTISNELFEDVATSAGYFRGALRQKNGVAGTANDSGTNQSFSVAGTNIRWYYPGAGMIKESIAITSNGLTSSSESQALKFTVDGASHGVAQSKLVAGVSPNVSSVPNPPVARPVVATDGSSYMVFGRVYAGTAGNFTGQWDTVPLSSTGMHAFLQQHASPSAQVYDVNAGNHAAAAFDGSNYLFVYEHEHSLSGPSLIGQLVSPAGTTVGPAVELASSIATMPTLAFDGSRFLLVYRKYTGASNILLSLEAAFITTDPLTGPSVSAAFTISQPNSDMSMQNGSLLYDGTQYFAAWEQNVGTTSGVYAARIGTNGSLPDGSGILVHAPESAASETPHFPVAIADHGQYIVVWQDYRGTDLFHNTLYAARVSSGGVLLDGPAASGGAAITTVNTEQQLYPTVVSDQGTVLVFWSVVPSASLPQPNSSYAVRGARLTSSATALTRLSTNANGFPLALEAYENFAAAGNSSGTMLVWIDPAILSTTYAIDEALITPVGP